MKFVKAITILVPFILVLFIDHVRAQQMVVDDAEITTYRSFQVESWYGSRESWILTAVSPMPFLEIGTGIGFDSRERFEASSWILESKLGFGDLDNWPQAYGLVTGLLFNIDNELEEVFAYVPYTHAMLNETSLLHLNLGLEMVREERWEYELFTGVRGNFWITERISILAEVAALNMDNSFYQAGFRFSILHDLLEMDITYGEGFRRMETAPGFNVGLSITPARIW